MSSLLVEERLRSKLPKAYEELVLFRSYSNTAPDNVILDNVLVFKLNETCPLVTLFKVIICGSTVLLANTTLFYFLTFFHKKKQEVKHRKPNTAKIYFIYRFILSQLLTQHSFIMSITWKTWYFIIIITCVKQNFIYFYSYTNDTMNQIRSFALFS